eukprot:scaffold1477_cov188-Alexandrium_tamarense.AAC.2
MSFTETSLMLLVALGLLAEGIGRSPSCGVGDKALKETGIARDMNPIGMDAMRGCCDGNAGACDDSSLMIDAIESTAAFRLR